jgi:hypothetical protein
MATPDQLATARAYITAMRAAGNGLSISLNGSGYMIDLPSEIDTAAQMALGWQYAEARKADPDLHQTIRTLLNEEDAR